MDSVSFCSHFVYSRRETKQKLTLSVQGIGVSPLHTITHTHRYQPAAEREREQSREAWHGESK